MLFLFWVIHFPPTKYEEAILYPVTQKTGKFICIAHFDNEAIKVFYIKATYGNIKIQLKKGK